MKSLAIFSALIVAIANLATPAAAVVINFDEIGVANTVYPFYTQAGFVSQGYQFSGNTDVVDISASAPWSFSGPAYSGNYIALNDYGGAIVLTKSGGGIFDLANFFIKGWAGSSGNQTITASLGGNVVASLAYGHSDQWRQVSTNFTGVDSINFGNGGIYMLDDLSTAAGAVPEPATWLMLIIGFGLVGVARRQQVLAAA